MYKKFSKLFIVFGLAMAVLTMALMLPVVMQQAGADLGVQAMQDVPAWMIAATHAQTTTADVAAEVTTTLNTFVPGWTVYVLAGIVIAFAAWLLGRLIRAGKFS